MRKYIFILMLFNVGSLYSQNNDSVILTYQSFIERVRNEHPYAKQAEIKLSQGDAKLLYAKGGFDPKVFTDIGQKYFKGDQYYSQINGGLKVPTWFGIELKGGYEQNAGNYLNPENRTPNNGLMYAGISMPIGQGLFIDKRRADLKKARIFQQITEAEQQILINELVYEAGLAYWKWFESYNTLLVYDDAYRLVNQRFEAVKLGAELGERPSVDTLEAGIQVQTRLLMLQQSRLKFLNASELLSVYLWEGGLIPLELAENTYPETFKEVEFASKQPHINLISDSLINSHPEINKSRLKIEQYEIDQRLKKEKLKPVLNLKYNPITEPTSEEAFANYSINNYTWGLEFAMPILLRKERGDVKLAKYKLQESQYLVEYKQEMIRYKVTAAQNQWATTVEQIELFSRTVKDYQKLLKAEIRLFNTGESSLFMVNSREVGYIKAQLKLIELLTKNRNSDLALAYSLGRL